MGFPYLTKKLGFTGALLLGCAICATLVRAGENGQTTSLDPVVAVESSNIANLNSGLNRLNPMPSAFKQAEEQLFKPFTDSIKGVNSMEPLMQLPEAPRPQAPLSKKMQEKLDRERNWAFTDLDDLYPETTLESAFGVKEYDADGREKKPKSVIEKYLDTPTRAGATNVAQMLEFYRAAGILGTNISDYELMDPKALVDFDLSKEKNPYSEDSDKENTDAADVSVFKSAVSSGQAAKAAQEAIARDQHREAFQRMLDPSLPPVKGVNDPYLSGNFKESFVNSAFINPDNPTQNSSAPQPSPRNNVSAATMTDPSGAFHSTVFDNPAFSSLNQPTPQPVQPVQTPMTAESAESKLNPYAASVKRPTF